MKKQYSRKIVSKLITIIFVLSSIAMLAKPVSSYTFTNAGRPDYSGMLRVEGTKLVDRNDAVVQLRGVSMHGINWYPEFINENLFRTISYDWDCNLVRLPFYSQAYVKANKEDKQKMKDAVYKGIELAIENNMYVIVDWHVLEEGNPNIYKDEATKFFDEISKAYTSVPNIIYEICNEPNGETTWGDVTEYANEVIPVIRRNSYESVIIVGTPEFDRNLGDPVLRPLNYPNIMYSMHFYAATHKESLRGQLDAAIRKGLPVFISECGISESSGDGIIDFGSAIDWFTYLNDKQLSYTVWSFSDKDESSAIFKYGYDVGEPISDKNLTVAGKWIRELIRGNDPAEISYPSEIVKKDYHSLVSSWMSESLGERGYKAIINWTSFFAISSVITVIVMFVRFYVIKHSKRKSYDSIYGEKKEYFNSSRLILILSLVFTGIYLLWRIIYSIPYAEGPIPIIANIILLLVEMLGAIESTILYENMMSIADHPLPVIEEDEYPDVDIFIATYNEPEELLRKTIHGCKMIKYPNKKKVHIWVCDDNRRASMKALAKEMKVGYFDRPDNEGAKAGNLNAAMARTSAPYVVTLDADMIPKSDFLLKTVPYFVDAEKKNKYMPEESQIHLGLLQTPQSFYDPDVFQHALYSEKRVPNEQDFFYRTIEVAKTGSNSVIYGGSNTMLSRRAIEDIGGFYTKSITEDFATGMLIESAGYVSLALPEPLANGQTPHTFREHIKQRIRWGRGVIATTKQLHLWTRKELSLSQKINYWSSYIYWYSPIKSMIFMLSPLLFAAFGIPVFSCNWLELFVFWLPMYIIQDICIRFNSKNRISLKWSGIYETSVMMHLFFPVIQETFGMSMSTFKVTDKSGRPGKRQNDIKSMIPFLVMIGLTLIGFVRIFMMMSDTSFISLAILTVWMIRNLYFLIMVLFLIDGRDSDQEVIRVVDAEPVTIKVAHGQLKGKVYEGVTTLMTDHKIRVYLDDADDLKPGMPVDIDIDNFEYRAQMSGAVTDIHVSSRGNQRTYTIEILDKKDSEDGYFGFLYDRVPTLPQSLTHDFGIVSHLWQNIAHRVARTRQ